MKGGSAPRRQRYTQTHKIRLPTLPPKSFGCWTMRMKEREWATSDAGGLRRSLPGNIPSRICSWHTKELSAKEVGLNASLCATDDSNRTWTRAGKDKLKIQIIDPLADSRWDDL